MNALTDIIPANTDKPCAACHRIHRKLILTSGHWLGQKCREDFLLFASNPDVTLMTWRGWEHIHAKIARMVNAAGVA